MKARSIRCMAVGLLLMLSMFVAGCSARASNDAEFAQYVVGTWVYEGDYLYRGSTYPDVYRMYTFESGQVAWISTGEDGSQCTYEFAGPDVIRIDCQGTGRELRALSVKRDGESLLIQELDSQLSPLGEPLKFTKVGGR